MTKNSNQITQQIANYLQGQRKMYGKGAAVTLKQIQSAIKSNPRTCKEIQSLVKRLGFSVKEDEYGAVSYNVVKV